MEVSCTEFCKLLGELTPRISATMDKQKPVLFVKDSAAVFRQLKVGAQWLHYTENAEIFS